MVENIQDTKMILYTEQQLLIAYTRYIRTLKKSNIKVKEPTIEEFRLIYETELEEQLFDDMENFDD